YLENRSLTVGWSEHEANISIASGMSPLGIVLVYFLLRNQVSGSDPFYLLLPYAIGHCRGEKSMIQALGAIRKVTRDGGHFYLDTRSWEWFRTQPDSWFPGPTLDDTDGHHSVIFHVSIPSKWSEPHVTEVVHITEKQGKTEVEVHPVTFFAFRVNELRSRLRTAGFGKIETNYKKGNPYYWVLCRAM
ncbi:MAG TPA: hypothetical protein VM425_09045, partial [Myxococcota bacterium]|nr:hypothetical protein [Myxococcota bacterium]